MIVRNSMEKLRLFILACSIECQEQYWKARPSNIICVGAFSVLSTVFLERKQENRNTRTNATHPPVAIVPAIFQPQQRRLLPPLLSGTSGRFCPMICRRWNIKLYDHRNGSDTADELQYRMVDVAFWQHIMLLLRQANIHLLKMSSRIIISGAIMV